MLKIKFFNGMNTPLNHRFIYTKPDTDFKEENGNAHHVVDAKPKTFFIVPVELDTAEGGTWRIGVYSEVTDQYGDRGVVRIDPLAEEALKINPDDPRYRFSAHNEEAAVIKGEMLWRNYLRRKIDEFENENNRRVTERGITPLRPSNFVAHAYKELGLEAPGDERFIKAGLQKTEVSELQATVKKQQEQIERLINLHMPASTLQVAAAIVPELEAAAEVVSVGAGAEKGSKKK